MLITGSMAFIYALSDATEVRAWSIGIAGWMAWSVIVAGNSYFGWMWHLFRGITAEREEDVFRYTDTHRLVSKEAQEDRLAFGKVQGFAARQFMSRRFTDIWAIAGCSVAWSGLLYRCGRNIYLWSIG